MTRYCPCGVRALAFATCLVVVHFVPESAEAAAPTSYAVEARVEGDRIVGRVTIELVVPEGEDEVRLWVYSDRLAVEPSVLDQHNARWIFPREIDLAETDLEAELDGRPAPLTWTRSAPGSAEGRDYRGGDVRCAANPGPHRLTVAFSYRVPERFGRLGRVGDRWTLTGPWYPLVIGQDANGEEGTRFSVPHAVHLDLPDGLESYSEGSTVRGSLRRSQTGWFVPVVAAPSLHVREVRLESGQMLRVVSHRPLYQAPSATAQGMAAVHDIARVDVVGQVARVAEQATSTVRAVGLPPPVRADAPIDVVLVPSRTELAGTAPGWVTASDRLYEIFPQPDVRSFHDRALSRAIFRTLLEPLVDAVDDVGDRTWSEDLRAVILVDLDVVRQQGEAQSAEDLIGWAGFHPLVDQLLYAPQVSFVDVWFGIAEPDPYRDAPERSRRPTARGRRLLEAARDVLSEDALRAWSRSLLTAPVSARASLATASTLGASRLEGWLRAPATSLNYRIANLTSERTSDGYAHVVHLERQLGEGSAGRDEPVEVRIETDEDEVRTEHWQVSAGPDGDTGEVRFETRGALHDVQVDPRSRVVQDAAVSQGHPRRDDTNRLPFRPPILQGINLAYSATEGAVVGLIDFAIRRRFDLENSFSLRLDTGPRSVGGLLRYRRGIGRKRDTNNRIGFLVGGLELDRLRADFSDDAEGGWRGAVLVQGGYNTLRWFLDPRSGSSLVGSVRAGLVRRDDGSRSWTLSPSVRGNLTVPIGLRASVVFVGSASWVFGDPLAAERPGLGGRFLMRGYQNAELVGRGIAFGVVEARFTPTAFSDMAANAVHIAWIREIQLALFAGVGGIFDLTDGRDAALGLEVGGGVRIHFEYGGVQPGVLVVDLAVPLLRTAEARATRSPVTALLAFEQYF